MRLLARPSKPVMIICLEPFPRERERERELELERLFFPPDLDRESERERLFFPDLLGERLRESFFFSAVPLDMPGGAAEGGTAAILNTTQKAKQKYIFVEFLLTSGRLVYSGKE